MDSVPGRPNPAPITERAMSNFPVIPMRMQSRLVCLAYAIRLDQRPQSSPPSILFLMGVNIVMNSAMAFRSPGVK